jgi:hypothetical protein
LLARRCAVTPHIHLHVFSSAPGRAYIGSKRLTWRDQHRAGAEAVLDQTRQTHTQWPAARQRYEREHPRVAES